MDNVTADSIVNCVALVLQMHNWLEEGQERDSESCKESSEAQRTWN